MIGAPRNAAATRSAARRSRWRPLHGPGREPTRQELVDGYPHRIWCDANGRALIEDYEITGLAHGTPLATRGPDVVGAAGPHMLEAGISSTRHIAAFWGIAGEGEVESALAGVGPELAMQLTRPSPARAGASAVPAGVGRIIEDALRSAGLMR